MVQLDRGGRAVDRAAAFDHVGVKRSLGQEFSALDAGRLVGEAVDEGVPDAATLLLRVDHAGQGVEEPFLGMDHVQIALEMVAELLDNRLGLALSQQPVVDQDTRELRPDGLREQRGHDGRIDAAGQSADHPILAHELANGLDRFTGEVPQLPGAGATAGGLEEVGEDLLALGRVRHLGMELQSVDRQMPMLHRGKPARVGGG